MNIEKCRIDKVTDVLLLTVGLYKLFLSEGRAGLEAMELYICGVKACITAAICIYIEIARLQ